MSTAGERYYRSSGAVPVGGILFAFGVTLGAVVVLAFLYALLDYFNPIVYLTFLATIGFGVVGGRILKAALVSGKVRNRLVSMVLSVMLGLLAVYATWVSFIWILAKQDGMDLLVFSTTELIEIMGLISEQGLWELKGGVKPTGLALQAFWLIEALIIVGGVVSPFLEAEVPYCEECSQWSHADVTNANFALPDNPDQLVRDLEDERYESLYRLGELPSDPADCLKAVVSSCPGCDARWLTVSRIVVTQNAKGEIQTKETALVRNLVVPLSEADALLALTGPAPLLELPDELQSDGETPGEPADSPER